MNLTRQPQAKLQTFSIGNTLESLLNSYGPSFYERIQFLHLSRQNIPTSIVKEEPSNGSPIISQTTQLDSYEQRSDTGAIPFDTTFFSLKVEEKEETLLRGSRQNALQIQVEDMLNFFIKNYGKIGEKELFFKGLQYRNNPSLANLFKVLIEKFDVASKNKQDMTRFVMRS